MHRKTTHTLEDSSDRKTRRPCWLFFPTHKKTYFKKIKQKICIHFAQPLIRLIGPLKACALDQQWNSSLPKKSTHFRLLDESLTILLDEETTEFSLRIYFFSEFTISLRDMVERICKRCWLSGNSSSCASALRVPRNVG